MAPPSTTPRTYVEGLLLLHCEILLLLYQQGITPTTGLHWLTVGCSDIYYHSHDRSHHGTSDVLAPPRLHEQTRRIWWLTHCVHCAQQEDSRDSYLAIGVHVECPDLLTT